MTLSRRNWTNWGQLLVDPLSFLSTWHQPDLSYVASATAIEARYLGRSVIAVELWKTNQASATSSDVILRLTFSVLI